MCISLMRETNVFEILYYGSFILLLFSSNFLCSELGGIWISSGTLFCKILLLYIQNVLAGN